MGSTVVRSTLFGPDAYLLKSKKPHIKELVENVPNMSVEEIEQLNEKPDVTKGLLILKKKEGSFVKDTLAALLADKMQQGFKPVDTKNEILPIYKYIGQTVWLKTGLSYLEIKEGTFWIILKNGDSFVSNCIVPSINFNLTQDSIFVKNGTLFDLKDLEKKRIEQLI